MATGLIALLDDVAALAKIAAASLDDAAGQAAKAGSKAVGVVVDDAAVTPRYVTGFTADRELPIIGKIALGSLRNKLLFLLPGALLLSWAAPWAITPLLMVGGLYLCFEGAEKLYDAFAHSAVEDEAAGGTDAKTLEDAKVAGAIRTDFILSAEIMAITLGAVADAPMMNRAIVLAVVGIGITALVYGVVALIVKADDAGVALARPGNPAFVRAIGRGLVLGMPGLLRLLGSIGTAAMLWVGGGIVIHGLETYGIAEPGHSLHGLALAAGSGAGAAGGVVTWLVNATGAGLIGLALGAVIVAALHLRTPKPTAPGHPHD